MVTKKIIPFNLKRLLDDSTYNVSLEPRDEVIVYGLNVVEITDRFVTIDGHVKNPGKFPLRSNMTLIDLILLAGGFTEDAYTLRAEVSRVRSDGLKGDSLSMILYPQLPRDLGSTISVPSEGRIANPASDRGFRLHHRDQVSIRPNPEYRLQQNIVVEGDFTHPGLYAIKKRGEKLSEILERAGGPTRTTYLGGASYLRMGQRLAIDVEKAYRWHDSDNDVVVMSGDKITFPSSPHTVLVMGEVNKPGLLSFVKGDDVGDYLHRAGGLTDSASYAILVKPTGESRRVNFGVFAADPEVPEGSSITVLRQPPEPPEEKKVDWGATIKDSFALVASAATIIYLISQVTK
jgi:protein involved in polysaccharide export with SLBB domain